MTDPGDSSSRNEGTTDDDGWNPDDVQVEGEFDDGGASGGAVEVVDRPGEFLTDDYWFEGERGLSTRPGTPFLWAMAGAGLYAASFVFAAVGLLIVAPPAVETYTEAVLSAVFFFPIPMVAFIGAGLGLEFYLSRSSGRLPETALPIALVIPILLHVSLFFVEWVDLGYTQATLADLFAEDPGLAQLLLWPPVIMGVVFAVIVHRTTVAQEDGEEIALLGFG
ncbi:hypothetical protein BRD00_12240 [Halobacteriales archaeon QS_8_69_26]|nr:MAG: hypothetical protein BRD00_12240 [Halobacteriales archaeon QS_8_69_26]